MKHSTHLALGWACAAAALLAPVGARAALHDRGAGLVYDDVLDVTWLADTTLATGSAHDDGASTSDGLLTWDSARAWAAALEWTDTRRGTTWTDWRLPTVDPACGEFGCGSAAGELGYMFYANLGGAAHQPISGSGHPKLALFPTLRDAPYWAANGVDPWWAYQVDFASGHQFADFRDGEFGAWAVRDGDVGAVPEPSTLAMSMAGLALLCLGVRRRAGTDRHEG